MQNSGLDLRQWIAQQLNSQAFEFNPLPGDASFRTYYRVLHQAKSYIVMVAPPLKERTQEFVHIASAWHKEGILVPQVLAWQEENGFVLLSDFGDELLLSRLNAHNVNGFYQDALSQIVLLQNTNPVLAHLPPYDLNYANKEIMLFQEWFITKLLNVENTSQESGMWQLLCKNVLENFCHQPQVTVHRDFHSRNLMVLSDDALGIIDFQDAMVGPITYDAVSLLKDCYISWPKEDISRWLRFFYDMLQTQDQIPKTTFSEFTQWFDWVGLQRHLKVLGIFSRLKLRDNKSHYLTHMPRIMRYVLDVTLHYPQFAQFHEYLQTKVVPLMFSVLSQHQVHFEEDEKVA